MLRAKTPSAEGLRRARISAAKADTTQSEETRAKIAATLRGRPKSDAHKAALSASLRRHHEQKRRAAQRAGSADVVFIPPQFDGGRSA